jgi:hypothetical protein
MGNTFTYFPRDGRAVPCDLARGAGRDFPTDFGHFAAALSFVDRHVNNLRFVLTRDIDRVPHEGSDVVVILKGDERYQLPAYAHRVLAVFKTGGTSQFFPKVLGQGPLPFSLLESARIARNGLLNAGRRVRRGFVGGSWRNVFPIPLGHRCPAEPELIPVGERPHDVFFAGNLPAKHKIMGLPMLPSPPGYCRAAMARAVDRLPASLPGARINMPRERLPPEDYAASLMRSKICLCPRGNFIETFRHYEAARFGCVIVSEELPDLWYFRSAPILAVKRWDEMPALVGDLLRRPERVEQLSADTLAWWRESLSEEAIGEYMLRTLNAITGCRPEPAHPHSQRVAIPRLPAQSTLT